MEPQILAPGDWAQLSRVLVHLYLMVSFAVVGASSWLLHSAVLPSLVASDDAPASVLRWRRILLPIAMLALALTLVALARAVLLAAAVLQQLYPRFLI